MLDRIGTHVRHETLYLTVREDDVSLSVVKQITASINLIHNNVKESMVSLMSYCFAFAFFTCSSMKSADRGVPGRATKLGSLARIRSASAKSNNKNNNKHAIMYNIFIDIWTYIFTHALSNLDFHKTHTHTYTMCSVTYQQFYPFCSHEPSRTDSQGQRSMGREGL